VIIHSFSSTKSNGVPLGVIEIGLKSPEHKIVDLSLFWLVSQTSDGRLRVFNALTGGFMSSRIYVLFQDPNSKKDKVLRSLSQVGCPIKYESAALGSGGLEPARSPVKPTSARRQGYK
jgi:hypothetical protein